ncbi:MAG: hypothetical protein OXD36_03595 [Rhodobacter sp.]|nr:hypothetical protein [Rhodobacter sp.]MCY4240809.1 hypothetical protein [Rhodobacter sp.]
MSIRKLLARVDIDMVVIAIMVLAVVAPGIFIGSYSQVWRLETIRVRAWALPTSKHPGSQ